MPPLAEPSSLESTTPVRPIGAGRRLERDRCRVGAVLVAAHDGHVDAGAPGFELVGCGGTERIGRAHDDLLVFGDEQTGQFAGRGGLAGAVDTDHDDDAGLVRVRLVDVQTAVGVAADQVEQVVAQRGAHLVGACLAGDARIAAQFAD